MEGSSTTDHEDAAKGGTQEKWLDACEFALTQPTTGDDAETAAADSGDAPAHAPASATPSDPNIFATIDYVCKPRDEDTDGALECDLRIYLVPFFSTVSNHHSTLNAIRPDYVVGDGLFGGRGVLGFDLETFTSSHYNHRYY